MSLNEVRAKIQEIDSRLVGLIAERTNLAKEVLEAKRAEGKGINDDDQVRIVLDRAGSLATEENLDTETVRRIFELLIQMSIERQHELSGEGNLP